MRPIFIPALAAFLSAAASASAAPESPAGPHDYDREITPILKKYCYECHSGDVGEGDIYLDIHPGKPGRELGRIEREEYEKITWMLRDREMPPRDKAQPTDAERALLLDWLENDLLGWKTRPAPEAAPKKPAATKQDPE